MIAGWQYDNWDEQAGKQHGWIEHWLKTNILVECPEAVKVRYRSLDRSPGLLPLAVAQQPSSILAQRLRTTRKARSLSQLQAAEQLQISQSYLSFLERERIASEQISAKVRQKLEKWFTEY